jgi:putative NADH-flavin reductase
MKIAVFGATGRTGVPLVEQAIARGHEVVAFVRDGAGLPAGVRNSDSVEVLEGDTYTGEGVEAAITGGSGRNSDDAKEPVDAVASVLGQTSAGPDDLLVVAGRHVLDAMEAAGVDRYVTLVGAGVREEGESVSLGGTVMGTLLKLLAGGVLEDANAHVEDVKASDCRWTVVRGPRLGEGEHTGAFRHGTDLRLGMRDVATRANVAEFILECLEGDLYVGEMPKIADS